MRFAWNKKKKRKKYSCTYVYRYTICNSGLQFYSWTIFIIEMRVDIIDLLVSDLNLEAIYFRSFIYSFSIIHFIYLIFIPYKIIYPQTSCFDQLRTLAENVSLKRVVKFKYLQWVFSLTRRFQERNNPYTQN